MRADKDHLLHLETVGLQAARKRAEERGREDALSGQHTIYSNADEPAEVTRLRAAEAENAARLKSGLDEVLVTARARSVAAGLEAERAAAARTTAEDDLAAVIERKSALSEERYGFAAVPAWALWILATLLFLGDVLFTYKAFNDLNAEWYETLGLAATIGALLFAVGVGKAYVDVVDFRGTGPDDARPWPRRYKKTLSRLLLWAAGLMIAALFFARLAIVDFESLQDEEQGTWQLTVASYGALVAIGFAAALVAIAAYLGAFVSFVSRPISRVKSEERAAQKAAKTATSLQSRAERAQAAADASIARAEGIVEEAPAVVASTWAQMRAAYWRGFALARPEEQALLRPLPTDLDDQ